jgi:hypothetical protein
VSRVLISRVSVGQALKIRRFRASLATALLVGSSLLITLGCTVGPPYKRPAAIVPTAWKGEGPWEVAAPKDAIPKGAWWQIFHDAELDRLEQSLLQANHCFVRVLPVG